MLRLRDVFQIQINSITAGAMLVGVSSLISRFLGVVRDRILASEFGAGAELDIYYAAFRLPDLIFNLVVLGALSAGFIPLFTSVINDYRGRRGEGADANSQAWRLANNVLGFLFLGLGLLSFIGIVFAPVLTRLMAPGFSTADQDLTVSLTRIMFLSPLFLGISGVLGGILQSFKRFLIYSIAPILYNLGIILGALYLVPRWGLEGLAWGVVLGAALHFLIQLPAVWQLGFRYRLLLDWSDDRTKKIARMMVPRTLSLAISQMNLVVITIIASQLSSGSLAVFNFANNLQSFPVGIFGISYAIAAFPALAASAFDAEKLRASFSQSFRQILFFIVPATVLIIALRAQIVRVVLGSGNFDWQDTILTMDTLALFSLSLFAQATTPLLVRVFYARHNSVTPFYIGLVSVAANVAFALGLSRTMGVVGLALAFSIGSLVNFCLLWVWLYFRVDRLDLANILRSALKFLVSALAAGMTAQITKLLVWPFIDMTKFSGVFIQLISAVGAGLLAYGVFCYLLQSEEFFGFLASLRRRLPFGRLGVDDQGEARGV